MDSHDKKDFDKDEVIQRLMNEAARHTEFKNQILLALGKDKRLDGLTPVGGITALMKLLHETEAKLYMRNTKP